MFVLGFTIRWNHESVWLMCMIGNIFYTEGSAGFLGSTLASLLYSHASAFEGICILLQRFERELGPFFEHPGRGSKSAWLY